ncbi:MAG: hypothetical protein IPH45_17040 [Bacteroidales bacterium]|nr:hypothetical protein [Bacteroidales bacterium]
MKKLYVILLMLMMAFMASAQTFVVISGTVNDINTGMPIVSQAVLVQTDSTGGLSMSILYTQILMGITLIQFLFSIHSFQR